jgi:hypothetical protein
MAGQPLPISHPRLQQLYAYWSAKKGQRKMPSRADIDVLDLRYVMGNMMLVDVIGGSPLRFRIRLHGSHLSQRAGYELTGKMLDELPETDFRKEVRERWTEVDRRAAALRQEFPGVRRPPLPLRIGRPAAVGGWRDGQHGAGRADLPRPVAAARRRGGARKKTTTLHRKGRDGHAKGAMASQPLRCLRALCASSASSALKRMCCPPLSKIGRCFPPIRGDRASAGSCG